MERQQPPALPSSLKPATWQRWGLAADDDPCCLETFASSGEAARLSDCRHAGMLPLSALLAGQATTWETTGVLSVPPHLPPH